MPDREFQSEPRPETEQEKFQRLAREQRDRSYKKVFSGPDGLLVLHDLLGFSGYFQTECFESANKQYFREGKRSVGKYIVDLLDMGFIETLQALKVDDGKTD